jgi:flagellar basal body rod protein FlgG
MKDIYTTLSGALSNWRHVELVSNNISNASTNGFREARAVFGSDGQMASLEEVGYNAADGELQVDNDPHHLALRGDGFFSLGNGSYTRDGNFHLDLQGNLVTEANVAVLDDAGQPVVLPPGEVFTVSPAGAIIGADSGFLAQLGLVQLGNPQPVGGNLWQGNPVPAANVSVIQGALEHSNADPLRGMVELIEASRYFEAQEKVMRTSDEMRGRLNRIQS